MSHQQMYQPAFARARSGGHGRGRATFAVIVGAVTTLLLAILAYYVRTVA
ncbi:hypothetical protein AB0K00_56040 [Dactylosporangium sp. NPDC049525]